METQNKNDLALKRRNTFNQFNTSQCQSRARAKTTYNLNIRTVFGNKSRTPKKDDYYSEYSDLVVESVKKNYGVRNFKPYAIDKNMLTNFQTEISELKQVPITTNTQGFYNKQKTITCKFNKLLKSALNAKKYKKTKTSMSFIQSSVQDDLENLIEDYNEEVKQERSQRQKVILNINEHIMSKYGNLVEKAQKQRQKNQKVIKKNKIVKFKKDISFIKIYDSKDPLLIKEANYNSILDLKKEDYGIYSRSANKALYYDRSHKTEFEENIEESKSAFKMQKKFYKSYFGSYSDRKKILEGSKNHGL